MTTLINAKEVCSALSEMISEDPSHNSSALLSGEREMVFRQVFTFYYPEFQDKLRKETPDITRIEELVCMLTALHETQADIIRWTNLSQEDLGNLCQSIREKMNLGAADLLGEQLTKMLG